jgi:hypothetical protein
MAEKLTALPPRESIDQMSPSERANHQVLKFTPGTAGSAGVEKIISQITGGGASIPP